MNVKVGTRGSALAIKQSQWLIDVLKKNNPSITFEMVIIKTKGDLVQNKPLDKIGDKGLFTKELEEALLSNEIDMAIHSMKDMPSRLPKGLVLTDPPKREDPRDVLITPHQVKSLFELPQKSVIGTGSKRRSYQVKNLRPDIKVTGIRGNVDTRIRKMFEENLDGIILAAAGLNRLGLVEDFEKNGYYMVPLDLNDFVPAPTQGILGVEVREDNDGIKALMATISDEKTRIQMEAERSFLKTLNGNCHIPVGVYCDVKPKGEGLKITGLYGLEDGTRVVMKTVAGEIQNAKALGKKCAMACYKEVHPKEGKVFLTGGGCGDPELLTIKAMKVLEKADVVVYDALVNESFLKLTKEETEIIYVGKRAGNHAMPQEKINELLVKKAKAGNNVVRLKGGDPYVFGRGGEEGEALHEAGIYFEVIPGITSAIGGLAYAGIPITHRDCNTSFHVITGHLKDSENEGDLSIDWPVLGKLKGTLVFLMGVRNLEKICSSLIENGMNPKTPVAVVHRASTPHQRVVVGNLETIFKIVTQEKITAPSLIVVGDVVKKREKLNFFDKKPLFGKNIMVTRSREQSSQMSRKIMALGGNPVEYPTIKIVPINQEVCDEKVRNIDGYTHLILTSVNGVTLFFESLERCQMDSRNLGKIHVTAIGEGTRKAVKKYGINPNFVPEKYVGEELVAGLSPLLTSTSKILIPRSKNARIYIAEELSKICEVDEVHSYETMRESQEGFNPVEALRNEEIDYITFTSSTTVAYFLEKVGSENLAWINRAKCVSIGPQTSKKCHEFGISLHGEAEEYTIDGVIECIMKDVLK
ncbi:MAG: hydroxymethylbilane synthase [Eubacteriaceae bacterium]